MAISSPFQLEVAFANLSLAFLGILCWKFRDEFWIATVISLSVFYLGATYGHIMDIILKGNHAPGNAGGPLYLDIILPILLIFLLVYHRKGVFRREDGLCVSGLKKQLEFLFFIPDIKPHLE